MASQEEAVVAQEEVKKVGEFPVNGAPNSSFNSRISSVPGEFDMAESQVAVAGSVDSAAGAPLSAGAEPDAVDTGPAVDATEKVESWDLSEAVLEGSTNKEDSKPIFFEDGTFEDLNTQASDSDLIASDEHVVEKAVDAEGAVTKGLPAATEDVNPKVQEEGSAEPEVDEEVAEPDDEIASPEPESVERKNGSIEEKSVVVEDKPVDVEDKPIDVEDKAVNVAEDVGIASKELPAEVASSQGVSLSEGSGDSGAPEPSVEEVHEVAEAVEPHGEPTSVEAVPDVEEKSDDVDDKPVDVEEKPVIVDEKPVVHEEKSVELNPQQMSEVASSEEVIPAETDAPEFPVEENHEVSEATTGAEAPEAAASVESDSEAPEPTVDEGHRLSDVTVTPLIHKEEATVEAAPSSSPYFVEKSVDAGPEAAGAEGEEAAAEQGDSEAPEPTVDDGQHLSDASITPFIHAEEASVEAAPSPSIDVEENSVEAEPESAGPVTGDANTEELAEQGNIEAPQPSVDEGHHLSDRSTTPLIHEEEESVESAPSTSDDLEEKSVEAEPEAAASVGEQSVEQGDSEAPEPTVDEGHHLSGVTITPLSYEEEASVETAPSSSAAVVEKSVDAEPETAEAGSEDVSSEVQNGESAEEGDSEAPKPTVNEGHHLSDVTMTPLIHEEGPSAESAPSSSDDVAEKSVDAEPEAPESVSEEPELTVDEGHHLSDVTSTPLIDEEAVSADAAPSSSDDVVEKSFEAESGTAGTGSEDLSQDYERAEQRQREPPKVTVDPGHHLSDSTFTPLIDEEAASQETVPAPAEDVEDKSVPDVESAIKELPSENADNEHTNSEPPAYGRVRSQTLFVPHEDVHEVVEATITGESGEEPLEPASSENVKDKSVDEDATTGSKDVGNEDVSPEPASEATTGAGADASPATTPATDVEDRSLEISPEEIGEAKTESADDEDVIPPFPTANVGREALYTPAEEVHEVVEATIAPEAEEESASAPAELPVDKEVVSRDLPSEAQSTPETTTRDFSFNDLKEAASTSSDVKAAPAIEEGSSSSDATPLEVSSPPPAVDEKEVVSRDLPSEAQSTPETTSRDFGFNDLKEALSTFIGVKAAPASEEGSSTSDATPLEVSSSPPAVDEKEKAPAVDEEEKAPKSSDLHEVVVELEDAAEKTLDDVKSSIVSGRQASVAESVAHIVLEEREKTEDSSELLSGVIQHVAQLAQDDFRADPNVLPDTVNQVFDREIASSPSNEASTQPKETTTLGTKFSLFIVWCISLCASHVSSKDMPAPALRLGAEEVAAVLQQNAQEAASSKAASSV